MNRLPRLDQRGRSAAGGRGTMRTGTGLLLIAVGAIFLFALRANSPHWVNWHIVGVILILVGAVGLLLPRGTHAPRDMFRRWVLPRLPQAGAGRRRAHGPAGYDNLPALVQESDVSEAPTLADRLLDFEDDQPL